MKNTLYFFSFLVVITSSCAVKDKTSEKEDATDKTTQLHDIWALTHIGGDSIKGKKMQQIPTLEIFVKDKKVLGNDGCNSIINMPILELTEQNISFGLAAKTKKMCGQTEVTRPFNKMLAAVKKYKLEKMTLILQNEAGEEVLRFKKVD